MAHEVKDPCCHCSREGTCCGTGVIPGPGISTFYGSGQKNSLNYPILVCHLFFPGILTDIKVAVTIGARK